MHIVCLAGETFNKCFSAWVSNSHVVVAASLWQLFVFLPPCFRSHTEKEKRVTSGSDGEGASNSQSDNSASLDSLKGGGESCHPPLCRSLPRRLCNNLTATDASGEDKDSAHMAKGFLHWGCGSAGHDLYFLRYCFSLASFRRSAKWHF